MCLHFHIKDACDPPLMWRYYLFHHCPLIGSVPRASISRDPFYDMLATRKRRIANKKWKETICSFFTSTSSPFSLLHEHLGDKVLLLPWAGCWGDLTHRWGNSRPPGHSHLALTNIEPAHSLYLALSRSFLFSLKHNCRVSDINEIPIRLCTSMQGCVCCHCIHSVGAKVLQDLQRLSFI